MEDNSSKLQIIHALRVRLQLDASLGSPFAQGEIDRIQALLDQTIRKPDQLITERFRKPAQSAPVRTAPRPDFSEPTHGLEKPVEKAKPTGRIHATLVPELSVAPSAKDPLLAPLREQALQCTLCGLCERRNSVVWGEGSLDAKVMFIGEGPGRDEDEQGRPFVGRSGRVLTDIIEKGMKMPRSQVYITNVVKCRPPGNRDPRPDEVTACSAYLTRQIEVINPSAIVAVGGVAGCALLGLPPKSSGLRKRWHEYKGIPLRVIFHPSYLLRQRRSESDRTSADKETWNDIQEVMKRLEPPV